MIKTLVLSFVLLGCSHPEEVSRDHLRMMGWQDVTCRKVNHNIATCRSVERDLNRMFRCIAVEEDVACEVLAGYMLAAPGAAVELPLVEVPHDAR